MGVVVKRQTGRSSQVFSREAGEDIKKGQPVYLTAANKIFLAKADAILTSKMVGVALADASSGFPCRVAVEGLVVRADWTAVAGASTLTPGATYFLSAATAGMIALVAPSAVGESVAQVGKAVGPTTLDIEIAQTVLL